MKQPQEIEVWYILPSLRKGLAKELVKLGMKQKDVASLLDVTEAAISQYFKAKRAKGITFNKKIKERINLAAKRIYHDKELFTKEIQDLCALIKKENILCEIHKKNDNIPKECDICFKVPKKTKHVKQVETHKDCPICGIHYKINKQNCPNCGHITGVDYENLFG